MSNINEEISSGSTVHKILKHGSVYFLVSVLGKGAALLLLPIYTRLLSPTDYGILSTITATGAVLAVIMSLRLDAAFGRFFYEYNSDRNELNTLLSSCFWFAISLGLIVYLSSLFLGYFYYHKVLHIQFVPLIVLGFFTPLLGQIALLGTIYYRQTHQSKVVGGIQIIVLVLIHLLSILLLLYTDMTVNARIIPAFIGGVVTCTYYVILNVKSGLLSFKFDSTLLFKILPYSLAMLPGVLSSWINGLSDRIILSIYGPMSETGIYSVGYEIGRGLTTVTMAIAMVYTPIMYAKLTQDYEAGIASLTKPILGFFWLMSMLTFFLCIFAKDIIYLFAAKEYQGASSIVIIIICSFFWGGQYLIFSNILGFKKKILLLSSIGIASALINIILNLMFIPVFGKFAAAWTTFLSVFVYAILIIYFGYRYSKPKIDWPRMFKVCLILCLLIIIYFVSYHFIDGLPLFIVKLLMIPMSLALTIKFEIFQINDFPFPDAISKWLLR